MIPRTTSSLRTALTSLRVQQVSKPSSSCLRPFSSANSPPTDPLKAFESFTKQSVTKIQEGLAQASGSGKDFVNDISKTVTKEVTARTAEQTSGLLHALILLSRSSVAGGP